VVELSPTFKLEDLPNSLRQSLWNGRCVPFVGAGLSIAVGLPGWAELLKTVEKEVEREHKNAYIVRGHRLAHDYLKAMEYAQLELGHRTFLDCLQAQLWKEIPKKDLILQRLVWQLAPPFVLTTNIDTLLETSVQPRPTVLSFQAEKMRDFFADVLRPKDSKRVLYKLHGSIDDPKSICVTATDYDRRYAESSYLFAYQNTIGVYNILFVGFSLTDEYVLQQFERSSALFSKLTGPHFALLSSDDARSTKQLWERYQITVIAYPSHKHLPTVLRRLAQTRDRRPFKRLARKQVRRIITPPTRQPATPHGVPPIPRPTPPASLAVPKVVPPARVPNNFKTRAIGEAVILAVKTHRRKLLGWGPDEVQWNCSQSFLRPPVNTRLGRVYEATAQEFRTQGYEDKLKFVLDRFSVEKGLLSCHFELTSWSMILGIQRRLQEDVKVTSLFWKSAGSLVSDKRAAAFPHHIGNHGLLISGDRKVILNIRAAVDNQMGRISASFEEQLEPGRIDAEAVGNDRFCDGDRSPFDALRRGARNELNVEITESRILALALEASSIAANFLAVLQSPLKASDIYELWKRAPSRAENVMIEPRYLPSWEPRALEPLLKRDVVEFASGHIRGRWHASSRARILLGLLFDFGHDAVKDFISCGNLFDL